MWVIRWVVAAIIILVILGFALQNTTQQVAITFIKGQYETGPLPIWIIVYTSFGLGMFLWLFISVFQVFALKGKIRKMRNENKRIRRELDNLRNLSVDNDLEIKALPEEASSSQLFS